MHTVSHVACTLLAAAGLLGSGGGQERSPLPPPALTTSMTDAERTEALDKWLAGHAAGGDFAGVVVVARNGKPVFERAYGMADRERGVPMSPDLRFNVASIGKAFTRAAIGQLVTAGKLALSDTLGTLLPDYPNKEAHPATVAQLLEHRGGIVDFFGGRFDATPKERFMSNRDYFEFVAPQPLNFPPGTREQYCNGCYVVLGEVIARVSGKSYEQYMRDHVFTPAGMTGAGFLSYGDERVTLPYTKRRGDGQTWTSALGMHGRRGSAAGGSFARAADLLAFDNAMREGRLPDRKTAEWFYDLPFGSGDRIRSGEAAAGGAPGTNGVLHSGPEWTVIVLTNVDPPTAERMGQAIARALRGV